MQEIQELQEIHSVQKMQKLRGKLIYKESSSTDRYRIVESFRDGVILINSARVYSIINHFGWHILTMHYVVEDGYVCAENNDDYLVVLNWYELVIYQSNRLLNGLDNTKPIVRVKIPQLDNNRRHAQIVLTSTNIYVQISSGENRPTYIFVYSFRGELEEMLIEIGPNKLFVIDDKTVILHRRMVRNFKNFTHYYGSIFSFTCKETHQKIDYAAAGADKCMVIDYTKFNGELHVTHDGCMYYATPLSLHIMSYTTDGYDYLWKFDIGKI